MPEQYDAKGVFQRRMKQARLQRGLSQKQLGVLVGLDEFVASTRINRYEVGVHEPDLATMQRIATVLGVPLAYLVADDDHLATMILRFSALDDAGKRQLIESLGTDQPVTK